MPDNMTATATDAHADPGPLPNLPSTVPVVLEDPLQPIPIPQETTLRVTIAAFFSYCLAYSTAFEKVIPPTMQWVIGFLAPVAVMRVPPIAATVMGSLGVFYTALMLGLASVTCLLGAITVSDGFFLAMVALWTLWMSGLRYGATGKLLNIMTSLFCVFFGMIGLGMHRSVRDGVTITISRSFLRQLTLVELPERLEEALQSADSRAELLRDIREKVQFLGEELLLERAQGGLESVSGFLPAITTALEALVEVVAEGCTSVMVPFGLLAGQVVSICTHAESGDFTISIPGGFWLVEMFWTAGVMHPLAIFPNLIVICSWVFLCIYASPLLPLPAIRTLRFNLSRVVLPQTLQDSIWYLQKDHALDKLRESQAVIDVDQWIQEETKVRRRLNKAIQTLHGGTIGLATAFEPRIFECGIPRNTWMPLKELTAKVELMAMKALAAKIVDPVQSPQALSTAIVELQQTATLLADATKEHSPRGKTKQTEPNYKPTSTAATTTAMAEAPAVDGAEKNPSKEDNVVQGDPLGFEKLSLEITEATSVWLESMYPRKTATTEWTKLDGAKHVLMTLAVWGLPSLVLLGRLIQILCEPLLMVFKKGYAKANWDTAKFFHCIKFTVGFTALVALAVYSDDYHELTVTRVEDNEGYELVTGNPPSSFAGWDLIAYVFATMPTTEGTVKKCLFRILGTCVGGFSAWLLILATGDNAIGSVSWLTITTAIGAYATVDKSGGAARFGASEDFGYGGFYLVLTQAVIVMEYQAGLGERDELVANRIAANILGILVAVFMSIIPPRVMGSSPRYTKLMFEEACRGLSQAAQKLAEGGVEGSEHAMRELQSSFLKQSNALRSDARFLMDDAKRLNKLPIFRVDAKLVEELDALTLTCAGIGSIMGQSADLLAHLESKQESAHLLLPSDLQEALKAISQEKTQVDLDIDPRLVGSPVENLVASYEILQSRFADHRTALAKL